MEEKKKRCQVAFDIDINFRQELKIIAARRNISMNLLIQRALQEYIKKEKLYENS